MDDLIKNLEYYQLLSNSFPSVDLAANEIVTLQALNNLPKGTEHFLSDIHGEYDAFNHMMRAGSGLIKTKVDEALPSLSNEEKALLCSIIYYPKEKLDYLHNNSKLDNKNYKSIISNLIEVAKVITSKHTRLRVRKLISPSYLYVIEELLQSHTYTFNKEQYYSEIINTIIEIGQADEYIEELCHLIQQACVDHLHILGDIFDRGNGAYRIMELLMKQREVDITFGNHDVLYMGAFVGNLNCVAGVIRNSCRYNTLSTIEEGYGISLRPLVTFASRVYADDPCIEFIPKEEEANKSDDYDTKIVAKMHKAITIILMKLDGQLVSRHPNYQADVLKKLEHIDFDKSIYTHNGVSAKLKDNLFETVYQNDVYSLTASEKEVIEKLSLAFQHSKKLKEHVYFLLSHGSMYLKYNSNLLYHGLIPVDNNGDFLTFKDEDGNEYKGKAYLDYCDKMIRIGVLRKEDDKLKKDAVDLFYFLWCCYLSPLYGKKDITSFENYFLTEEDKKKFHEDKSPYYTLIEKAEFCKKILKEFGITNEESIIVNGHMPVHIKSGETPIKGEGKLVIIDGGICKAYHKVTGIAGYTLTSNSYGINLIAHDVFESKEKAVIENKDIVNSIDRIHTYGHRMMIKDTDEGEMLNKKINYLKNLLLCYRQGLIQSK